MTDSPLYANLSDPGSDSTSEPQKPAHGQTSPESGAVAADLAVLQSDWRGIHPARTGGWAWYRASGPGSRP